jgi:tetratricopeptide (TPR) repeat protein
VAQALGTLAFTLEQQKKYEEAGEIYHQTLVLRQKLFGSEHPTTAWTTYNYADFLYQRGEYQESVRLCREVLALRGHTLPDIPLVTATCSFWERLDPPGNPVSASPHSRGLRLRQQTLPANHWLIASAESARNCLTEQRRLVGGSALLSVTRPSTKRVGTEAPS